MRNLIYFLIGVLLISSCTNDYQGIDDPESRTRDLAVPAGFDFSMTKQVTLDIFVNHNQIALGQVPVQVYLDDPGSSEEPNASARKSYTFFSNSDGKISESISLPSYLQDIYLKTGFVGLPDVVKLDIGSGDVTYAYGDENGYAPPEIKSAGSTLKSGIDVSFMGEYNYLGVPSYLTADRDQLSNDFLQRINASLPENRRLPDSHPDYLADGNEADVIIKEDADVWVTFVHEGAGYVNTLAYYVYDQDNPPQTIDDIEQITAIFPNASFLYSGGGLRSGDKVYLGQFESGQAIGWVLFANGWNYNGIRTTSPRFSDYRFNLESDEDKKKHMVLLFDEETEVLLMGFEDMDREAGSDDDFNDAIFYVSANPIEAIEVNNVPPVDNPEDNDEDGISNTFDDYPNDPNMAFDYFYPAENEFGSLVVEDLWPSFGDFDFNDLVVDYQFRQYANPQNQVVKMDIHLKVRAIGASFHNGFGIELPVSPSQIASVTGYEVPGEIVSLMSKGLENGQENAVVIAFEDAFDILSYSGVGTGVNTSLEQPHVESGELTLEIILASPVSASVFSHAPYNPFIFINGDRGKEVHLPGEQPTQLADESHFGSGQDDSQPGIGRFYVSEKGLPWMLNIPESFTYPLEKVDIIEGYNWFSSWAVSGGANFLDWYTNADGYRENSKLYIR